MEIRSVARYIGTDVQLVCESFQKKKKKKVQQSDGNIMQTFIHIKSLVIKTFYLPWWILVKEALNML